jgi:dGTPase
MQLFAVQSDQFIRNRLTHSLEVAQIARSIAMEIGYKQNEIYVVEAAALAHDIGNPPFGHAGERFLNELAKTAGGFEGNAQTFRILTTVEQKRADFQGLNLTYRTLLGVLKYYNRFNSDLSQKSFSKQKFIYNRDYEFVQRIIKDTNVELRTIDVQIVDLADEIAYAAHDLEDGLRLGSFTLDDILHDFYKDNDDEKSTICLENIINDSKERVGFKNRNISSSEFSKLYRKEVTSRIIYTLINDIGIITLSDLEKRKKGTTREKEIGFVNYSKLASGLKKTTYECITNTDEVYAYEQQGQRMLESLYNFYLDKPNYLPPEYRADNIIKQYNSQYIYESKDEGLKEILQKRLVLDYISGMMDEYVKTTYNRLNDSNMKICVGDRDE